MPGFLPVYIGCCILSGDCCFFRYKVHKIMHMKHISAGKNTFDVRLQALIDLRTGCHRVMSTPIPLEISFSGISPTERSSCHTLYSSSVPGIGFPF